MLSLQSVSIQLENKLLVSDLSLTIKAGEIVCILGHNGVGKSTLLKTLAGIGEQTQGGEIMLHGNNISELSAQERYHAGLLLLYQTPPVIEGITVFQLLRAVVDKHLNTKELLYQIKTIALQIGLPEDIYSKVVNQDLSGGQKKLLELLQAILLRPKVLLCDEIDSGLDITKQKKLVEVLTQLAIEDMIIICVTHSLSLADELEPNTILLLEKSSHRIGGKELLTELQIHGYN